MINYVSLNKKNIIIKLVFLQSQSLFLYVLFERKRKKQKQKQKSIKTKKQVRKLFHKSNRLNPPTYITKSCGYRSGHCITPYIFILMLHVALCFHEDEQAWHEELEMQLKSFPYINHPALSFFPHNLHKYKCSVYHKY